MNEVNDIKDVNDIDQALAKLPARGPDVIAAERMRLRARLELRRTPEGAFGQTLSRAWYVAEPWVVGATMVIVLTWTVERMAILLGV